MPSARIADRQDLQLDIADGTMPDDLVADPSPEKGGGERRDPGYAAVLGIRLVLTDDRELALTALGIGNANGRAESDLVMRLRRRIDEDRTLDTALQVAELARDIRQRQVTLDAAGIGEQGAAFLLRRGNALAQQGETAWRHIVWVRALRQIRDLAGPAFAIFFL